MNEEISKGVLELRKEIREDYERITGMFRDVMTEVDNYLEYLGDSVKGGNKDV